MMDQFLTQIRTNRLLKHSYHSYTPIDPEPTTQRAAPTKRI